MSMSLFNFLCIYVYSWKELRTELSYKQSSIGTITGCRINQFQTVITSHPFTTSIQKYTHCKIAKYQVSDIWNIPFHIKRNPHNVTQKLDNLYIPTHRNTYRNVWCQDPFFAIRDASRCSVSSYEQSKKKKVSARNNFRIVLLLCLKSCLKIHPNI